MEYKDLCAVVIAVEDDYPVFARVEGVYVVDGNRVLLQVCVFHTSHFDRHCHVYVIQKSHMLRLIDVQEDLHHPHPYSIRKLSIDNYTHLIIVPKYHTGCLY